MIKGLSNIEDSHLIGYVKDCLYCGAITIKEAHEWVHFMIEKYDDLPTYMYYLTDTEDVLRFDECIGFSAYSGLSGYEGTALSALAYYRNPEKEWFSNIPKGFAVGALKRNPQVVKRFHETFPFIELNDDLKALLAQAE